MNKGLSVFWIVVLSWNISCNYEMSVKEDELEAEETSELNVDMYDKEISLDSNGERAYVSPELAQSKSEKWHLKRIKSGWDNMDGKISEEDYILVLTPDSLYYYLNSDTIFAKKQKTDSAGGNGLGGKYVLNAGINYFSSYNLRYDSLFMYSGSDDGPIHVFGKKN